MAGASQRRERFGRYRILELLGEGANGLVFAAEDPEEGARVALKVLRSGLGSAADLKREFRLVADLTHPNLVLPYALETDDGEVFITMELVDGAPILAWLERRTNDEDRLRHVFKQAAEALVALHQRGLFHRDVKPSNILVEDSGRVALLDFGLVRHAATPFDAAKPYFAGTPSYLAPEILHGGPASAAADAYALGVILHQALTGRWPFHHDAHESIARRLVERAPVVDARPEDLARICGGLLAAEPEERLTLGAMLAELHPGATPRIDFAPTLDVFERDRELARLARAFEQTRTQRRARIVHLPGHSGMGKSALLRSFATRVRPSAWVLEGRAYERDTVPYKAIDAAMDQLAQRLSDLTDDERGKILPASPEALHFLFPALGNALRAAPPQATSADPVARRRAGGRALRDLLANVSEAYGLVLALDDLQWGDLDSARLLIDLLTPPAPALLAILAYRTEQADAAFLALYKRWEVDNLPAETVPVERLSTESARRLAARLSGGAAHAAEVAKESDGCPFLIEMLLTAPADGLGFEGALARRLDELSPPARRMLEAVCLAARPIPRARVPFAPSGAAETWSAWAALVSGRLLRSEGSGAADHVEPYHDRIRDAVTRTLSTEAKRTAHLALGESFAAQGDAENAAPHLAAAGDRARAYTFARAAAGAALSSLAFDRAAQLLDLALTCCPASEHAERRGLLLERARALANAGRGGEAASLYLLCADQSSGLEAADLRREAMEKFLLAGHIDEGRPVLKRLLADLDVWQPTSSWLTHAALYAELGRLLLRGPEVRPTRDLSERERLVLATFASIGKGFASYDATLGAWFYLRALRRALDWGDPVLTIRGITYVAALLSFSGSSGDRRRAERWVSAAEALAHRRDDGQARALCRISRGMIHCCAGDWERALATFDEAAHVLESDLGAPSHWEADMAKNTSLFVLVQLGDLPELALRASALTREARGRGDLALEVEANLYLALAALGRDNTEDAHHCIDRNVRLWTARGYHFQHWIALRFRSLARLYEGAPETALARLDEEIPCARSANLTAMQLVRIEAHDYRGRAALASAAHATGRRREHLLAEVRADIERLAREKAPHALAPAEKLRGGLALVSGDRDRAITHFALAQGAYEKARMKLHALTTRWHIASVSQDSGELLRVERAMEEHAVHSPARWARMHLGLDVD